MVSLTKIKVIFVYSYVLLRRARNNRVLRKYVQWVDIVNRRNFLKRA